MSLPVSEPAAPHRMGAAPTYARRYALFTLVGMAAKTISMRRTSMAEWALPRPDGLRQQIVAGAQRQSSSNDASIPADGVLDLDRTERVE